MHLKMEFDSGVGPTCILSIILCLLKAKLPDSSRKSTKYAIIVGKYQAWMETGKHTQEIWESLQKESYPKKVT